MFVPTLIFLSVMSKEDVDEMVERKDYQLISYLMSTTISRPPSEENAALALKTAQCFMTTCELVPSVFPSMVQSHVVTWVVRFVTPSPPFLNSFFFLSSFLPVYFFVNLSSSLYCTLLPCR